MNLVKKNSVAVVILVLVIFSAGALTLNQNSHPKQTNTTSSVQAKSTISVQIKADSAIKDYQVQNAAGKTALEITKLATNDLKMTGEGVNAFITAINGRQASSAKKEFWKLIINGKDAQVGAGSYTVKENDKISWEIDTY